MSQPILLRVPEELGRLIVVDWLDLKGIIYLERALCGVTSRKAFLSLSKHSCKRLSTQGVKRNAVGYACVCWCIASGSKIDGVSISTSAATAKAWGDCLSHLTPDLSWVNVDGNCCGLLPMLAQRNPNLQDIEVTGYSALLESDLAVFTSACRHLTNVKFARLGISPEGLARALANCDHLTHLTLDRVSLPDNLGLKATVTFLDLSGCTISGHQLRSLARSCPRLHTLFVFQDNWISEFDALGVLNSLPLLKETDVHHIPLPYDRRLKILKKYGIRQFDSIKWKWLNPAVVEAVLYGSANLTRFACRYRDWLTDATLAVCAEHCPLLEDLELLSCIEVTNHGVLRLMQPGNRLRRLVVLGCPHVGEEVVLAAAQHCPLLEVLICEHQNQHADALAKGCPRLKRQRD